MSDYKKSLVRKLQDELEFEKSLRHWEGHELHAPGEREFELEDQIADLENRDEFGEPRW